MIGYLCAYLRYYYPMEFITAFLNNAETQDDVVSGMELADTYGISIISPRFGLSNSDYMFNKEKNVISKGMRSIKFLNSTMSEELYNMSKDRKYESFIDLLYDISNKTSTNSRQLGILIDLDFFSDFGNSRELEEILKVFILLNDGTSNQVSNEKIKGTILETTISKFSTNTNAKGDLLKNNIITDIVGLLKDAESIILGLGIKDYNMTEKMNIQLEYLGYIDLTSDKKEDARKLIVTEVTPLMGKFSDLPWAYKINTKSIYTGKMSSMNIKAQIYNSIYRYDSSIKENIKKRNLKAGDIIKAGKVMANDKGYWYLYDYEFVI